jgi:hypothetical protein
MQQEL